MPLISTTAGVVWIDECGSGEPLLLLHGHPGDSGDFDAVLPALSERYRVIRVSWPGFGQGPAPLPPESASAMQYAELLVHLVATLDLAGVRVVGHSVGGYAAAWLALCQPDRIKAVVLVAPGGFAMVGNSLRSDIEPVVRLGGWGIHMPYHVTWAHELDNGLQPEHERRVIRVDAAPSIPKALAALQSRAQSGITGRD